MKGSFVCLFASAGCYRDKIRPAGLERRNQHAASRTQNGAALIIILALVVLLTVMVLAYFSYVALQRQIALAGVNQTAAQIFAQGAIHVITDDIRQEISAGSTNLSTNTTAYQLYFPLSPTNAVPALAGSSGTNGLENLVKRSSSNNAFFPGGNIRASASSTTNASQNGRSLSPARWNAPLLLPKSNTNSSTDLTPINTFTPPDWVLVARDGSNPQSWNSNMLWSQTSPTTVVGRYAYTIYDEGGLLDVNAAGYPPGSSTNATALKGGIAYADLTVLPGMTTNAVTALVGWRNSASARPGGSFPSYTFDGTSQTNYFNSVQTNSSGFLRTVNTNTTPDGQTDRMFVSRQQLIQFLTQAADPGNTASLQNALQYLGTFSRDLEQPSFRPDPNRPKNTTHNWAGNSSPGFGGSDSYDPSGAKQNVINPVLLAIRDTNDEPVMKRRFPLNRIALIKTNPTPAEATKIYDWFGLTWDSANHRWSYNHGTPNKIMNLSEIPTGREPDFFETLKAVIHCDSIAKQYGGTGPSPTGPPLINTRIWTSGAAAVDGVINYQILQIGANIIDQYDTDSYPTAVEFTPQRIFYGVENLPYIEGWITSWYRMKHLTAADIDPARQPPKDSGGNDVFPWEVWVMIQPILWNPHSPDATLNTSQVPTNFRVMAGSTTGIGIQVYPVTRNPWWTGQVFGRYPGAISGQVNSPITTDSPLAWVQSTLNPATSIITFHSTPNTVAQLPGGSDLSSFQEPYRLLYQFPPGSSADTADAQCKVELDALGGSIADTVLAANDATADGKTVIGFFAGKAWAGPWNALQPTPPYVPPAPPAPSAPPYCLVQGYLSTSDIQLTLQYQDPDGNWLTYDRSFPVYTSGNNDNVVDAADTPNTGAIRAFVTGVRTDPRTERWGLFNIQTFPLAPDPATSYAAPIPSSTYIYDLPQGTTLSPGSGFSSGFIFRAYRNASGLPLVDWSTSIAPSDLSVNLNVGTTSGASAFIPGGKFFYNDPDHVLRAADGGYKNTTLASQNNNGLPFYKANFTSRPVILNRPFRSVAELGHVFSDTPWKSLNFFTPESGNAALLDAFCLNELDQAPEDATVAGRVNLNTRQPNVLAAIIGGVSKAEGGILSPAEARNASQALVNWTTDVTSGTNGILTKGPLRNRSELVGKFISAVPYANTPPSSNLPNIGYDGRLSYSGFSSMLTNGTGGVFTSVDAAKDAAIKRRRECVVRALADSGNVRTWNLLIDIVAQVGRYSASATNLDQFIVEGETRWWVHIAIDRCTGRIISRQLEAVSE